MPPDQVAAPTILAVSIIFLFLKDVSSSGQPEHTAQTYTGSPMQMDADFLAAHNEVRAQYSEPPLAWDPKLAAYANHWALKTNSLNKCEDKYHSYGPYGENLFWGDSYDDSWSPRAAVMKWADERKDFNVNSLECKSGAICGHFTQIVWRNTKRVGCCLVHCQKGGVLVVCNYDPPGNWLDNNPAVRSNPFAFDGSTPPEDKPLVQPLPVITPPGLISGKQPHPQPLPVRAVPKPHLVQPLPVVVPQPSHHQPAQPIAKPQPAQPVPKPQPAQPISRPQPVHPQPVHPVGPKPVHPQPVHPVGPQPVHPQPVHPVGPQPVHPQPVHHVEPQPVHPVGPQPVHPVGPQPHPVPVHSQPVHPVGPQPVHHVGPQPVHPQPVHHVRPQPVHPLPVHPVRPQPVHSQPVHPVGPQPVHPQPVLPVAKPHPAQPETPRVKVELVGNKLVVRPIDNSQPWKEVAGLIRGVHSASIP